MPGPITQFIQDHYRHFNAVALRAAAADYIRHLQRGGKMLITLAGAMSTAELGIPGRDDRTVEFFEVQRW